MTQDYLNGINQYKEILIHRRRHLHQYPETSFNEYNTVKYIEDFLETLDHCEVIKPTKTSVIGIFKTGKKGSKIGLRADIDALPIQEEAEGLLYQSQNDGVMHACGHDGHTSMLMTACQWFNDHIELLSGEVYCIFQHAEELPPGGAQEIVDTGILKDLDFIYGQHVYPELEVGQVDIKEGPVTANSDVYKITIYGLGGHASAPHQAINPLNVVSKVIQAFTEIPSQQIDAQESAVVSNTYIQAGNRVSLNIIPDSLELGGNIRTFNNEVAQEVQEQMKKILDGICGYYGASYQFAFEEGARSVHNDPEKTKLIKEIATKRLKKSVISQKPGMFGEDFSAYSNVIPATFVMLGSSNGKVETQYPLHHPKFNLDEDVLMVGLEMFISIAVEFDKQQVISKMLGE